MSNKLRDKIRTATLGAKKRYSSEIVDFNDVQIEVRQLSIADRNDYMTKALDATGKNADILKLQINSVIVSSYVPGTDEKVFEDTDYEVISKSIAGGYADVLWEAIQRLNNFTADSAKKN
jgi:hypothetical protein